MSRPPTIASTPAADPSRPGPGGRRHTFRDLYHERTNYQFIDRSWRWAVLSGSAVLISLLALVFSGLNLGIDFEGGTQWQFTVARGSADAGEVRAVLADAGQDSAKVLILGGSGVRVQTAEVKPADRTEITEALAEYAGIDVDRVSVTNVGPTWGDRVSRKALQALVVFFIAVSLYLSVRFEARMALAAVVAVVHDIIITTGVYAVTGFEVTPATIVAFLTILGFSLYDTVVVFDKVKENEEGLATGRGETYSMMVNRSLNQVLMRSLNTSFVAVLPVVSLLVVGRFGLGAVGLQDFALALFVGLVTGAYSSIFVATPLLARMKERVPRYRSISERVAIQAAREKVAAPVGARAAASVPEVAPEPVPEPVEPDEVTAAHEAGAEPGRAAATPEPQAPPPAAPTREPAPPPAPEPAPEPAPRPAPKPAGPVAPRPRQQRRKRK